MANGNEKKEGKVKKVSKSRAAKPKSEEKKGPGVFESILEFITKHGPISKDDLHKKLIAKFPDRDPDGMQHTIQAQLGGKKRPLRFERERKVKLQISEDGKFSLKE